MNKVNPFNILDDFTILYIADFVSRKVTTIADACSHVRNMRYVDICAPYHLINLRCTCRRFAQLIAPPPRASTVWLILRAIRASDPILLDKLLTNSHVTLSEDERGIVFNYAVLNIDTTCTQVLCRTIGHYFPAVTPPQFAPDYGAILQSSTNKVIDFIDRCYNMYNSKDDSLRASYCATLGAKIAQIESFMSHKTALASTHDTVHFIIDCCECREMLVRRKDQINSRILVDCRSRLDAYFRIISNVIHGFLESQYFNTLHDIHCKRLRHMAHWVTKIRPEVADHYIHQYGIIEFIPHCSPNLRTKSIFAPSLRALRNEHEFEQLLNALDPAQSMANVITAINTQRLHIRNLGRWYRVIFARKHGIISLSRVGLRALCWLIT